MLVVGLTGSIGMGKSAAAAHFRARGVAVFDADACVHEIYAGPEARHIEAAFPGTVAEGRVDRQKLAQALGGEAKRFKQLEAIVHPLVRAAEREFLQERYRAGETMAVLEVPLLYETGGDALVDASIVVSASPAIQRERVLARPGMTQVKFDELLRRQMSDEDKRRRADFVVDTNGTLEQTGAQIDDIITELKARTGTAFQRHWS